jgi:hypothetical protein
VLSSKGVNQPSPAASDLGIMHGTKGCTSLCGIDRFTLPGVKVCADSTAGGMICSVGNNDCRIEGEGCNVGGIENRGAGWGVNLWSEARLQHADAMLLRPMPLDPACELGTSSEHQMSCGTGRWEGSCNGGLHGNGAIKDSDTATNNRRNPVTGGWQTQSQALGGSNGAIPLALEQQPLSVRWRLQAHGPGGELNSGHPSPGQKLVREISPVYAAAVSPSAEAGLDFAMRYCV